MVADGRTLYIHYYRQLGLALVLGLGAWMVGWLGGIRICISISMYSVQYITTAHYGRCIAQLKIRPVEDKAVCMTFQKIITCSRSALAKAHGM